MTTWTERHKTLLDDHLIVYLEATSPARLPNEYAYALRVLRALRYLIVRSRR